jgi:hypothetical protein
MSESKAAESKSAPPAVEPDAHGHAVDFKDYLRRCLFIFIAILFATSMMIWISYLPEHYSWAEKVAMILTVAVANAFVVAGFLMHLISEKKMIYTVLAFTVFFVAGLFALTLYAMKDIPAGSSFR